jgi:LemA protein
MNMHKGASFGGVVLGLFVIIIALVLISGLVAYRGYNHAVQLDETVKSSWAQVDNALQRRYELIPNLVETVKGYASHEKEIFEQVADSRTKYFSAGSQTEKVEAANGMERALSRLLVLKETYPELKAQASFLALQDELAGSENRVAVERKRYNDAVRELNSYRRGLLSGVFANWAKVEAAEYFEAEEAAQHAPKVDFSTKS